MIQTREIAYRDEDHLCKGYLHFDVTRPGHSPAMLVSHKIAGHDEFAENNARRIAELGYASFALDMYGERPSNATPEENRALMNSLLNDRALLARRIRAALSAVRTLEEVDPQRIAAVGYCFGGLCVRDL